MSWWAIGAMVASEMLKKPGQQIAKDAVERQSITDKFTQGMDAPEYASYGDVPAYRPANIEYNPEIGVGIDDRLRQLREMEAQRALQGMPKQAALPPSGYGDIGGQY